MPLTFTVPDEADGQRLDRVLTALLPDRSRAQVQRLIEDG
ncbi:MAG: S4 domain-containing protein, partial [Vicinamibacterales bacterium]